MSKQKNTLLNISAATRISVITLSLVGLGIMTYLTYIHFIQKESFCDLSEKVSCNAVAGSIYADIFGIPISVLGVLYFLFALISSIKPSFAKMQTLFLVTIFVLLPSAYFSLAELLFIKTWCILCEGAKIIMVAIVTVLAISLRKNLKKPVSMIAPVIIAGLVAAFITFTLQQRNITAKDYTPLVNHLNQQGWVYYKSYTCQNCAKQGNTLGTAYQKLNSVECHPDGPNGHPDLCLSKNISKTPTWLLESSGIETKRLEGRQTIQQLIEASGFSGQPNLE